jgi:hypothetical protein
LSDTPRSLRRGQSFIGLLVVLLVLTLLTAFAATKVDLTRYRSDTMARRATLVFVAASRAARQQRHAVLVLVDSAGGRLGTVHDRNGNGLRDASEPVEWTVLDATADIMDPPRRLAGPPAQTGGVVFRPVGGAANDFVLYLTTDPGSPKAWRAVQVNRRGVLVQFWRFDGTRWARGRS